MLDPTEASFLRSIALDGDNNAGRMVFADWLDDHGHTARAEFVRVQCELTMTTFTDERRLELRHRERDLLDAHWQTWCRALAVPAEDVRFERGLLSRMRLSAWDADRLLDPAVAPQFGTLTELDLSALQLGDDDVTAFAANAQMPALRKLLLSDNAITAIGVNALARATGLPNLDTVYLAGNSLGDGTRDVLERSSQFRLTTIDLGERPDGYCMSPGEAEMARRQYIRAELWPVIRPYFDTHERLRSAMLVVAQYWDDEAIDAVHGSLIVSELPEPTMLGVNLYGRENAADANLPTTLIKSRYGESTSSEISLWDANVRWHSNDDAIPLWAVFAPEGGNQNDDGLTAYAPAVLFYRHGGYEFLPMLRPQLDGVRPEYDREE